MRRKCGERVLSQGERGKEGEGLGEDKEEGWMKTSGLEGEDEGGRQAFRVASRFSDPSVHSHESDADAQTTLERGESHARNMVSSEVRAAWESNL